MKSIFAIVGMKHRGTEALVAGLPRGETLTLIREPTNAHDPNAVQVWARDVHAGFVKGTQARGLAQFMDRAGHAYFPAILAVTAERWPCAEVDTDAPRRVPPLIKGVDPTPNVIIKEGRDV